MGECAPQVAPRAAGASNPQHRLHEQPVILAAAPGIARLAKTQRLHFRPLGVCQNESVHPELESQPRSDENPESQQTLVSRSSANLVPWISAPAIVPWQNAAN